MVRVDVHDKGVKVDSGGYRRRSFGAACASMAALARRSSEFSETFFRKTLQRPNREKTEQFDWMLCKNWVPSWRWAEKTGQDFFFAGRFFGQSSSSSRGCGCRS